ncbi:MAG: hypothetical protein IKD81_06335 [Eubacteriaceae bacterium]|nr:hypothetical protein [Eubacteriaceae bacterium]
MVIKAAKATVEADKIANASRAKHHQTNTHNAQTRIARGNVELRIDKQYPTRSNNAERPPAGSVIRGKTATISARKVDDGKPRNPKRVCKVFSKDVTVSMKNGRPASSAKKKSSSKK